MNRLLLFSLPFALFTLPTYAQTTNKEGYRIDGTIKGVDSGVVRMLSPDGNDTLNSAAVVKGRFSLQGKIGAPDRMLFNVSPGNWNFRAFVEDTALSLRVDTAGAKHYGKGANSWALIWEIEEAGSALSDVYAAYTRETDQTQYSTLFSSLRAQLQAAKGNAGAEKKVQQEMDSLLQQALALQKGWIENYIGRHPSSEAGVFLFYEYCQSLSVKPVAYLDSVLNRFTGAAVSYPYYARLVAMAANLKHREVNSLAPDFTLLRSDRTPFMLSSTRGHYTLIDFWASWCVPCRRAIPAWKEVYTRYKDKGFTMVSVSNDRHRSDWIRALDKEQMPWVQVIDEFPAESKEARVAELFETGALPFYVLLDKEGRVLLSTNEEADMRKKIDELFR